MNNNGNVPTKRNNMSFGKALKKGYLTFVGIFLIIAIFCCGPYYLSSAPTEVMHANASVGMFLLVLSILFGWIPGLIYAVIKTRKK